MHTKGPFGAWECVDLAQPFTPCALYLARLRRLMVVTKDCSYTADRVTEWLDLFWENHRPWYAPWEKCVGFQVHIPESLVFRHIELQVTGVLGCVAGLADNPFGDYQRLLYRLAKDLTVRVPA